MCGIAGYITKDGNPPKCTTTQLKQMFTRAETRGIDASGIFWTTETTDKIFKLPVRARELNPPWSEIRKSPVCLMHTRHATQGSPSKNYNNHPLTKYDLVLIHNGIIGNSGEFVSYNLTDSYSILEAYHKSYKESNTSLVNIKRACKQLEGSIAGALYHLKENRLFLVRHRNPLCIGLKGNTIFFASTPYIMAPVKSDSVFEIIPNHIISIKGNHLKSYKVKFREAPKEVSYYENQSFKWGDVSVINGD